MRVETGFPSTILPDSKILILGTLPPYGRNWYYEKDELMWEILETATNDKRGDTKETKEEFLKRNKIALWDVLYYGKRYEDESSDKILEKPNNKNLPEDEQNPKPNIIWDNLQNVEVIITNGSSKAFKWLKKYNSKHMGDFKANNEDYYIWNDKIVVYRFYATSYINNPRKPIDREGWKQKWIKTIKKHLDNSRTT